MSNGQQIFAGAVLAMSIAGSAGAAEAPSTITVVGHGKASRPADVAALEIKIRGEGRNQVEALRNLSSVRERIEAQLPSIRGVAAVQIKTGELEASETRGADCPAVEYGSGPRLSVGPCAVTGYVVSLELTAQFRPAERVGAAASLAAELGATEVSLGRADVDDRSSLEREAASLAVQDATRQADVIAAGARGRVGRILHVRDFQIGMDAAPGLLSVAAPAMVTPKARFAAEPAVPLNLTVPPVEVDAAYVLEVELLR